MIKKETAEERRKRHCSILVVIWYAGDVKAIKGQEKASTDDANQNGPARRQEGKQPYRHGDPANQEKRH
jgi:hypothetical protein